MSSNTVHAIESGLKQSATTDDIEPGGIMPREVFDEFYNLAIESSELLGMVNREPVTTERTRIPKFFVGERLRRGQSEYAAGAQGNLGTDHVDVDCKKGSVRLPVSREFVENNIEGRSVEDRILNRMSRQFAADTQELAILGDEDADTGDPDADDFFQQNDGYLKLASESSMTQYAHVDDSDQSMGINNAMFNNIINRMPERYLDRGNPSFLVSRRQMQSYRFALTEQYDNNGYAALMSDNDLTPFNYDVVPVANWPDDRVMFTDPMNLMYAIFRDVEVEKLTDTDDTGDLDLHAKFYIRTKDDFQIENTDAGVLATDLAAP